MCMVSCISRLTPPHAGAEVWVPVLGSKPRCLLCIDNGATPGGSSSEPGPSGTGAGSIASKENYWCIVNEGGEEGKGVAEILCGS